MLRLDSVYSIVQYQIHEKNDQDESYSLNIFFETLMLLRNEMITMQM